MQSRQLISFDVSPPRTQISTYKRLKLCINILLRFSAHSDLKRLPYKMNSFPSAATWSLFIAWSLLARVHERDGDQEGALPTPRAYRPCRRSHPRPSAHVSTLGLIKAARGDVGLALSSSTPGHPRRRRRRAAIRARWRTRTRVRAGRRYGHERRLEFLPVRGRGTDQQAIGPFLRERPTLMLRLVTTTLTMKTAT